MGRFNRSPLQSTILSLGYRTCGVGSHEQSILFRRSREQLNNRSRLLLHVTTYSARKKKRKGKGKQKKYVLYTIVLNGSFGEMQHFLVGDLNSSCIINIVSSFQQMEPQGVYPVTRTCHLQFVCIHGVCRMHVGKESPMMTITKGYGGSL